MNKVFIIGNLTADPELRTLQSGVSVCEFTVAVNRRMKSDGEQKTDFIRVTAWRKLAELCVRYLAKGRKVAIAGSIQSDAYTAKDGTNRVKVYIQADEIEFLSPVQGGGHNKPTTNQDSADTPYSPDDTGSLPDNIDDEIPF